jgi:trimeric autotransporter adhesin
MKRSILFLVLFVAYVCAPFAWAQTGFPTPPNRVNGAIDETERITFKNNVHPLALKKFDRGAARGSMPTGRIRLVLQRSPEQQQKLTQYLSDLQNPASPAFHKWLTPEQFGAAFGVSKSDLLQIQSWLQSHGFEIERIPAAHNIIEFSGTFDKVQSAFHTSIHTFIVNGETHFANVSDPQIPAALAGVIAGVGPLNDFHAKPMLVRGPNGRFDPSIGRIVPELTLSGNNTSYLYVDPADAAIIYDTPNSLLNPAYSGTTYDGTGVSIGIAGVSDLTTADVANYRMAFLGESSGSVNLPTVVVDGNDPGLTSGGTEALLDNEVAGGIAPKSKIYFYTSADTDLSSGLMNAIFRALDDDTVSILSISFSNCEASLGASGNQEILAAGEQAAAQGITMTVSAGDNGSAGCDDFDTESQATQGFAVNGLASTPYTIAVGGTDFDVLSTSFASYVNNTSSGAPPYYATALKYIPENPWNDSTSVNTTYSSNIVSKNSLGLGNIAASSGGVSSVYAKPAFQSSITPNDGFRDVPDVSLLAGNGMYLAAWVICSDNVTDGVTSETYTECQTTGGQFTSNTEFGGIGGTSASAPAFAGMLALVAQAHGSPSDNYRLGQADNILYQLAQSKYSTVFHDETTGNNSVACVSASPDCGSNLFLTGYNAGTGYDLASGLGSVNAAAMVNNWNSVSLASTSTNLKINGSAAAYTGVHGQSLTFDVSVSPVAASGVAGIVDNADETNGGIQNNGQFAVPLSGGAGSAVYNGLPGGSYTVWARYGGDTANASSTSTPPISVSISAEPSTTIFTVNAYNPSTGNAISGSNIPYGFYVFADAVITGTAEGTKTQGVATGTVQFLNGGTSLGASAVSSGNEASWPPLNSTFAALPAGSYNLTAQYSGDASYSPSTATASFTIAKAPTTTSAGYAGTPVEYGNQEQIAADVLTNSFGIAPTGTFQFNIDGQSILAPQPIYESGGYQPNNTATPYAWADAQTTYTFLSAGQHTLSASYSGDPNYAASASPSINVTVTQAQPFFNSLGWSIPNPPAAIGQQTTVTASLYGSQSGAVPTGNITFYDNGNAITGTVSYSQGEGGRALMATMPYTFTAIGSQILTASYSGDANYLPVTSNLSNTVNVVGPISISATAVTVSAPGQSGTSMLTVTPSGGFTGAVNLSCQVSTSMSSYSDLPTCSVPASVTISGTSAATATLTVNTTAATTGALVPGPGYLRFGGLTTVLAVVFFFGIPSKRRKWTRVVGAIVLAVSIGTLGCGGGSGTGGGGTGGSGGGGNSGTTPGAYSVTLNGTDAATGKITAQATASLSVN